MSLYLKTKKYIDEYNFKFKKNFGQNFIIDENIIKSIIQAANLNNEIGVIEIGTGVGTLTEYLVNNSKKVLAYEIDLNLKSILEERFKNVNNLKVIYNDILKSNVKEDIIDYFNDVKAIYVVANLPYYITTPILMYLLEETDKIDKFVIMVQKEMGDRFLSEPNKKDYNALSCLIQYQMNAKKLLNISKNVFIPKPNVDSMVLELKRKLEYKKALNEVFFKEFVKNIFKQRRKTVINNLNECYKINKEDLQNFFKFNNLDINIRAEALNINQIIDLSDNFYNNFIKNNNE